MGKTKLINKEFKNLKYPQKRKQTVKSKKMHIGSRADSFNVVFQASGSAKRRTKRRTPDIQELQSPT